MSDAPHVLMVPLAIGGRGRDGVYFQTFVCIGDTPRNTKEKTIMTSGSASSVGRVRDALSGHPEKLEKREGLTAKAGDVYDTASLATLIRGNEAIISAFNPGWQNPKLYDDQVRGTASIIAAIKKAGIKRVFWVGGAGGLEVTPGVRFVDSPDMPLWVKPGALATINALDQLRKEPELEWSYLSPSAELKPGQRTGKFRLGNDQLLVDATGQSKISVQDYAVAMIDELERPTHVRRRFTVEY
jgi:uncharacterized protein